MSALLAFAKASRAIGNRLRITAEHRPIKHDANRELLLLLGASLVKAADDIDGLAAAEASGPPFEERPQPPARKGR